MTWSYWPISLFWKTFGVFPVSLNDHRTPVLFTICLIISSIYVLYYTPLVCKVGIQCTNEMVKILKEIFPGIINVTTMVSRIALLCTVKLIFRKYKETLECYELYSPTTPTEVKCYKMFTFATVSVCLLLIIPINIIRLHILSGLEEVDGFEITLYILSYVQNLTMCCSETQFTAQCFMLHRKLKKINDEIIGLKGSLIDFSRYLHQPLQTERSTCRSGEQSDRGLFDVSPRHVSGTTADAIETLRIRHWLLREAIGYLNDLFSVQLCMSACALSTMIFFDIYYEMCHVMGEFSLSNLVIYNWLLQYGIRYAGIILISHFTTKQVDITFTW
ncbi:Hypothetical protein CINCED_3A005295 [Cinara cedri]|uniref:Gustatory receptor n=1 Tax=Cinara cedri TaxID=506608 RepID=A0A5E4M417_9HEMI|nr:Hypothetical protein CINCED_3A005295 [Cinara cedri]